MKKNEPIPIAMLTSTEPTPTIEFECFDCEVNDSDRRMTKQLFSRNGKMQYKLTCKKHGETWVQL